MTYFVPFLLDLFPLLVFVILDSLGKMRYALIGAIAAAGFELIYSYLTIGYLDNFSLVFASIILVFAAVSLYFNNPIFFRLKPALIGSITGVILVTTSVLHSSPRRNETYPGKPICPSPIKTSKQRYWIRPDISCIFHNVDSHQKWPLGVVLR